MQEDKAKSRVKGRMSKEETRNKKQERRNKKEESGACGESETREKSRLILSDGTLYSRLIS